MTATTSTVRLQWLWGCLLWVVSVHSEIVYTDVSLAAGLTAETYASAGGHGLGVNWVDVNNDGWDDLFAVGGKPGIAPKLFINNRNGTFTAASHWLPKLAAVEMSGSRFADYDGDGDKDIFIYTDNLDYRVLGSNNPDGPVNILLQNQLMEQGSVSFVDQTATAQLLDLAPSPFGPMPAYRSKTATWLDYDRDGCIDLFVGHSIHNGAGHAGNKDRMYRNDCDGTFSDVTAVSGVNPGTDTNSYRAALASAGFHLDDDLWPDLFVVNVSGLEMQPLFNDFLYLNHGPGQGTPFQHSLTQLSGVGNDSQAGMGIDTADIDHDGDWDVYISDILNTTLDEAPLGNVLYLGTGQGQLADNSAVTSGVQGVDSWGVNFLDADHDSWEDLFVATIGTANGDLFYHHNGLDHKGVASFSNIAATAGIVTGNARGSAIADFDRDGDLDIAVVNQNGPLQLFRNDSTSVGNWLVLRLIATESNADAIGAVVQAEVNGVTLMRQVKGGSSAHSQDSLNVHFGLGAATQIERLTVLWPSGRTTELAQVPVNRYLLLSEAGDDIFMSGFEP